MLPDVSDALLDWVSPYTIKTITRQTVDFVESNVITPRTVSAMVQPADPQSLKTLNGLDWSLKYVMVHSLDAIQTGEYIEYGGEDYKLVSSTDWQDYGYTKAIGEQTKRTLLT